MSFKNPRVTIGPLSLWDINPNDIALKNDFQDKLLSLAQDVMLTLIQYCKVEKSIKVLKGMASLAKTREEIKAPTYIDLRYTSANALCVTWDQLDKEEMKLNLRKNLNKFENNLSVLIHEDKIEFYRSEKRKIEEFTSDKETRVFFVDESSS